MNLRSLKKMAAVSAVALGVAFYASSGYAVLSGDANPVDITATIDNTIDVTFTTLNFGTVAAIDKAADTATFEVLANGTVNDDAGATNADARILADPANVPVRSQIDIAALGSTLINVDYVVADDTMQVGGAGKTFLLTDLFDSMGAPAVGVAGTNGNWVGPAPGVSTAGTATTDAAGDLQFFIGGRFDTEQTLDEVYPDGVYTTTFSLTISY